MNNEAKNGMACSEFEALLADALDNALAANTRQAFDEHGRSCDVCGPMLAEALEGMLMVRGLAELEPPKNLVHNILAATSRQRSYSRADRGRSEAGMDGSSAAELEAAGRRVAAFTLCHVIRHGVLFTQHHAHAGWSENY